MPENIYIFCECFKTTWFFHFQYSFQFDCKLQEFKYWILLKCVFQFDLLLKKFFSNSNLLMFFFDWVHVRLNFLFLFVFKLSWNAKDLKNIINFFVSSISSKVPYFFSNNLYTKIKRRAHTENRVYLLKYLNFWICDFSRVYAQM